MNVWLLLKIFGDICAYFSIISALPGLFPYSFSFFLPALAGGVAAAFSDALSNSGRPWMRLICITLSAMTLFLADSTMEYLVLTPVVIYCGLLILLNKNELEYYSYRQFFKRSIIIWCICFAVICLLYYFENATQAWRHTIAFQTPLLCGLLYMFSGIMMLRQLRTGVERGNGMLNGAQMAITLGGVSGVLFGLVMAEKLLVEKGSSVLKFLRDAAIVIFTAPLTLMTQLISGLLYGRFELLQEPDRGNVPYTEPPVEGAVPPPVLGTVGEETLEPGFPWLLALIILAVMLTALLYMLRTLEHRRKPVKNRDMTIEFLENKRHGVWRERSNREKIRQIYRKFLKQQREKGMTIRKHHTSMDIQARLSRETNLQAAQQLRDIYVLARYDMNSEITIDTVNAAKSAFRQLQQEKEND